MAESAKFKAAKHALGTFRYAMAKLVALEATLGPSAEAAQGSELGLARYIVERTSYDAAKQFDLASVGVAWKAPGSTKTRHLNPAYEWKSMLLPSPKFDLAVLDQCIADAEHGLRLYYTPSARSAVSHPRRPPVFGTLGRWLVGVFMALMVAYVVYHLGWA